MNRHLLITSVVLLLLLGSVGIAAAQNNVTFQVNMKVQILETSFLPGSGDIVRVAGDFNGWGGSTDTLKDVDGDSIYTLTKSLPAGTINYKFLKTLRGGKDWEGDPNRSFTVAGNDTIPAVYFDRDSVVNLPVPVGVTFQVNMRIKMLEGSFLPKSGDAVRVAGSFNGWGSSTDTLSDANNDSIYTKTININEKASIEYKFLKTPRGGLDWENVANRKYDVPVGGGTLAPAYFDNDTIYNAPISGNLLFQTNIKAFEDLGWFRPDQKDTLEVRGGFNGWAGTKMDPVPGEVGQYEVALPYSATIGDHMDYKFFIRLTDSTAKAAIFEGFRSPLTASGDGFGYEHPAERGDGNRGFDLMAGGDIEVPMFDYSDINPGGVLGATDSVTVTLRVNMGPAKSYVDAFVPGSDTLRLVLQDALWRGAEQKIQGVANFPSVMPMSPIAGGGDSLYQVTFKVKGPTHYNIQYTYRYIHPGGNAVDQGGGLGGQNPYITRFIQPVSPNHWPATYTAPIDQWKHDKPLPGETAPLATGVAPEPTANVPLVYSLSQNYPNPFNPATRIKYSIPEGAHVSLKVYNVLGQVVATLVNEQQAKGAYVAMFEAPQLASGVYFYRLEAGKFMQTMKMLLLK